MNYIVSVDSNWAIGKKNGLLFHISADMKYFKETTMGGTVIMGDNTFLSLPGQKPLKGRKNIVISLDESFEPEDTFSCHSLEQLGKILSSMQSTENVFVIGGATIYNLLEPYCKKAYITKVNAHDDEADVKITDIDKLANWQVVSKSEPMSENGIGFSYYVYENNSAKPFSDMK